MARLFLIGALGLLVACPAPAPSPSAPLLPLPALPSLPTEGELNGDGLPDAVTWAYTGGAHCCYVPTLELSGCGDAGIPLPFLLDGGGACAPGSRTLMGMAWRASWWRPIPTMGDGRNSRPN